MVPSEGPESERCLFLFRLLTKVLLTGITGQWHRSKPVLFHLGSSDYYFFCFRQTSVLHMNQIDTRCFDVESRFTGLYLLQEKQAAVGRIDLYDNRQATCHYHGMTGGNDVGPVCDRSCHARCPEGFSRSFDSLLPSYRQAMPYWWYPSAAVISSKQRVEVYPIN